MIADILPKVAGLLKEDHGKYRARPSLCGPERCIRQMTYWAAGVKEDKHMGDRFIMVLDDSSWHAYLTIDWINKSAYKAHSQEMAVSIPGITFVDDIDFLAPYTCGVCGEFVTTGKLHGHIDGIITDLLGDELLFEHKALNHFTFNRYASGETFPLDYITQCCLYVRGVQLINPKITKALLLIKNKNTSQYLEMVIHYDKDKDSATINEVTLSSGEVKAHEDKSPLLMMENVVGDAFRKLAEVHAFAKNRVVPPRPFEYGTKFPCGYCSWEDTCWNSYPVEVMSIPETEETIDGDDVLSLVSFYSELGAQSASITKQRDELKPKVMELLRTHNTKKARVGDFMVSWTMQEREIPKAKEDIAPELWPKIFRKSLSEFPSVRKIKPKGDKK